MIQKILYTFLSRAGIAGLNFAIVWLTARYLGAENRGVISIFLVTSTIIVLFNRLVGSSAIIYLIPRTSIFSILVPSYAWALISNSISYGVILIISSQTTFIDQKLLIHLLFLPLLQSISDINLTTFIGKEDIRIYNQLSFFQVFVLVVATASLFYFTDPEIIDYIGALYLAYAFTLILSTALILRKYSESFNVLNMRRVFPMIFKHGSTDQLSNIVQFFNYRVSYYFLLYYHGKFSVGVLSVGVAISESLWIVNRSISLVQYAKIANSRNKSSNLQVTNDILKWTLLIICILLLIINFLPEKLFLVVFGDDFEGISDCILYLTPGILLYSLANVINHYFSGVGKFQLNVYALGFGFVSLMISGFLLIKPYNIIGASLSNSISFATTFLIMGIFYIRQLRPSISSR